MNLSAELSLYPLASDVNSTVLAFIESLVNQGNVSAVTNSMSTQISGEWDDVMAAVSGALKLSYDEYGRQVLVAKFIPEHRLEVGPGHD